MILTIKVKPGTKSDSISKDAEGTIHVRIKAPPVDGKANKYLIEYLSNYFKIKRSEILLVKGETSQHKTIRFLCDENKITMALGDL